MKIRATLLTLFVFATADLFAGGPWLHSKGHGFAQAQIILPAYSYSGLLMSHFRDVQAINRYTHNSDYILYAEYGIGQKLDLITTLPFKYVKTGNLTDEQGFDNVMPEGSLTGLSNYHLGLKYGILDAKVKAAISLHTRWNTGSFDLEKGLATGYDANSFGVMAHIGRGSATHYGFVEFGYHYFTNNLSDVIELNVEHGWKVKDAWFIAGALNGRFSLGNGSYNEPRLRETGLYPNNQQWLVGSIKASRDFKNGWGLNTTFPLLPIYFKYVGFNGTFSLGLFKKF